MSRANYRAWTADELNLLSEAWVRGGLKAARAVLPGRSDYSIKGKAESLMLRLAGRKPYERYEPSEFVDAALKRAYAKGRPDLIALSKTLQRPKGWLKYRAGILGLRNELDRHGRHWSDAEDEIVRTGQDRGLGVPAIRKRLVQAGYRRSLTAVCCRLQNLELGFNRNWWTATQVAAIFNIDIHSVLRWIDQGWLTATRKQGPSAIMESEERRQLWAIRPESVRDFMLRHPGKWDHRRVRKEVLLDLLCPERFNTMASKEAA